VAPVLIVIEWPPANHHISLLLGVHLGASPISMMLCYLAELGGLPDGRGGGAASP